MPANQAHSLVNRVQNCGIGMLIGISNMAAKILLNGNTGIVGLNSIYVLANFRAPLVDKQTHVLCFELYMWPVSKVILIA